MALTEEQILQQINVLTLKTSDNTQMVYKANATLNKALNPDYFSGNNTKIVNAINLLATDVNKALDNSLMVTNKINEILLDTDAYGNDAIWAHLQELMGKETIIEGLESILEGKLANKILGVTSDDIDKILSVGTDQNGDLVIQAIDKIIVNVTDIKYFNDKAPSVSNIKAALDYLFDNMGSGNGDGGLGGGVIVGDITWDMIEDKPVIAEKITLEDDSLQLVDADGTVMAIVQIMNDSDLETLLQGLE